jgi:hypothetical protein
MEGTSVDRGTELGAHLGAGLISVSHYPLSFYFMHYNFVRIHQTLRVTPAMEAGVTDRLWDLTDIVRIVDEWEATKRRP